MKKLERIVSLRGVGKSIKATLVKRTARKALYLRNDGVYEVFKIRKEKACEMFGKKYPDREVYPCNEDFGKIAWSYNDRDAAEKRYADL